MQRVEFIVEGSKGDEYVVTFGFDGGTAAASCTCKAAVHGLFCKHRLDLMEGDITSLVSDNDADVARLPAMLHGTDLQTAYGEYLKAEAVHAVAKRGFDAAKKALARVMHKGEWRHRSAAPGRPPRAERTEHFDIRFRDGMAEGWAFGVPEAFRDQLDIRYLEYVDAERSRELRKRRPRNEDGSPPAVFRMAWSRGEPPLRSFGVGHVFYDPPGARGMAWADALEVLRRSVQVTEARADEVPGSGWVKVDLRHYEGGGVVRTERHNLSQAEFEDFLRTGLLPPGHEAEPEAMAMGGPLVEATV